MEKKFGQNDSNIANYVESVFRPEDDTLAAARMRQESAKLPPIQVGGMDVRHLEILALAVGAKKIVEIGTLGGYSGISLARGLAPNGHLHTFEFDPRHATVATENFAAAGLANRVTVHVGAALDNLSKIEGDGPFDLVFIDADKVNYPNYLDWAAKNLRIGGLVVGDNAFAFGHIASDNLPDNDTRKTVAALKTFNRNLATDGRFRATMLPTGEGLAVGVKV